jgi:hypothetical protein
MGEIIPGVAVFAVVLADRAPLPLAQVGSPFLPWDSRLARLVQPFLLSDINSGIHFFGLQLACFFQVDLLGVYLRILSFVGLSNRVAPSAEFEVG